MTVRAAVLSAPRRIEVTSVAPGPLPPGGAWIDVEACGLCGSDWSWYADRPIAAPLVPGHEIVGRVAEVWGERPAGAPRPGDRVALEERVPCRSCALCRSGRHRLCQASTRYGATSLDTPPALWGGFAERVYLAPAANAHAVPSTLDAELAVLFIPVSNGLSWVSSAAGLRPGESVVVLGVGQHGLATVAAARRCGAGTVVAVGRAGDEARLRAAQALGADTAVESDRLATVVGPGSVDVVVDTTPGPARTLTQAVGLAAPGGRVVLAGLKAGEPSPVSTDVLVRREITVRGVAARESWAIGAALRWLHEEPGLFAAFGSLTFGLGEVEPALLAIGGETDGPRPVHAVLAIG
ncbi:zinc-dependent alcohol dehydrogenase [Amycolatopsis sp.]|uniref:zinc-dependent alcohol dehydrogenase n=1 Tax=Amycolatopsis sp. TaxID=37632 RepID=UPI002C5D1E91|nr:alcohol dehydrogenase catalytic domain-containing protein [Amycolatopsis sp.]HVV08133.1 alcohol dehydrogenase catalytic domain-containing protein [Amycolatopsis sp.]